MEFLPTDVKVGFVSDGESFNKLSSLVDVTAHKRSTGFNSAPSASRLAPRCIHTFTSAWWYSSSLRVAAAISTSSGSSAQTRESRYNWARPICCMRCVSYTYKRTIVCA
jgi:hypothetical protein